MSRHKQIEDLTENRDIRNKYTICLYLENKDIRFIGLNENTILIKNRILILCLHQIFMDLNENMKNRGKTKAYTYKITHIPVDYCPRELNLISE